MQELYFSMFLSLASRKGTSISPVFDCNDSSTTFQGHTNLCCITGRYKRGHMPGLSACTGVSCSLTYVVLRLLPAIQEDSTGSWSCIYFSSGWYRCSPLPTSNLFGPVQV